MSDTDQSQMLYTFAALRTADAIKDWVGLRLKRHAKAIAKRDGRNLITAEDMLAAIDNIKISDITQADLDLP